MLGFGIALMRQRASVWALLCLVSLADMAPCSGAEDGELTTRWTVLHAPARRARGTSPLPENSVVKNLPELKFQGPEKGHPFLLGEFAADGDWCLVDGGIQLKEGKHAALRLANAVNFELEGSIAVKDFGGLFLLCGWNNPDAKGYCIQNIQLKQSDAPWYICEMEGTTAVSGTNQKFSQVEWKKLQPVKITVKEQKLTIQIGTAKLMNEESLANYGGGDIILGVHDTRYGPRPIRIESLRIRLPE
ncbi:MAG: hypothetical protein R3C01_18580 [Planctomycetaceae bacterium]